MMRETRPLSPHVQIYRPQITSALSILHRATGVGFSFGLVAFIWWLIALAGDSDDYQNMIFYLTSPFGLVLFSGWAIAFCFHLANGLRHLGWDMGHELGSAKSGAAHWWSQRVTGALLAVVKTEKSERFEIVSSIGRKPDELLVRNLIVNGVNLGLTYRNQFNELMSQFGDADKAIDAWSETIEEATGSEI